LNLKSYFNEKARLLDLSFANCRNCYIGTDHTDLLADTIYGGGQTSVMPVQSTEQSNFNGYVGTNAGPGCPCPFSSSFSVIQESGTCPGGMTFKVTYSGPNIP